MNRAEGAAKIFDLFVVTRGKSRRRRAKFLKISTPQGKIGGKFRSQKVSENKYPMGLDSGILNENKHPILRGGVLILTSAVLS